MSSRRVLGRSARHCGTVPDNRTMPGANVMPVSASPWASSGSGIGYAGVRAGNRQPVEPTVSRLAVSHRVEPSTRAATST